MFDDLICVDRYGDTVRSLTQWDLDQVLYIYDTNFPVAPEFHYSNQNTNKALVVQSHYDNGVLDCVVPNQLMIEPYPITCYLYIPETNKGGTVVGMFKIPVRPRPQPDDFEYEDNVDVVNIKILAAEIQAAEDLRVIAENQRKADETTRQGNELTRQSNEQTRQSNEQTRQSNEAVRQQALINTENATARANTAAAGAETIIARYDTDLAAITAAKNAAETAATNASVSELNASTSETNAASSATSASTSATNAAGSATDAASSATDAASSASDAAASALASEGWADETQNGQPVPSTSPYYHNSARYWASKAQAIAEQQLGALSDVSISNPQDGEGLVYDSNSHLWINKIVSHLDDAIGEKFDTTKNYEAGDVVIYQDKLYRFTEDHTAGPWDSSEVEEVSVVQLISEAEPASLTTAQKETLIGFLNV